MEINFARYDESAGCDSMLRVKFIYWVFTEHFAVIRASAPFMNVVCRQLKNSMKRTKVNKMPALKSQKFFFNAK